MAKNKFYTINIWFLVSAISIVITLSVVILYSLQYLSSTLLRAFGGERQGQNTLNFNIEKAKNLGF